MEDLLCKAFDEVYEHEFDKYKKGRFHFFSFRHRRMMKELFSRLEKNEPVGSAQEYQYVPKKKRPALLVVAIIFSVLLSITAAAYTIYSFSFKKQHDHTIAFSENIENSPTEIKHIYVIDSLPAGYEESKRNIGVCFAILRIKSVMNV